jgi:hypothetical protein
LSGQRSGFPVDAVNLVFKAEARQGVAVGAEGVGFNQTRARLIIFPVNFPDDFRTGKVQLFRALADGNAFLVQPGSHRPVAYNQVGCGILFQG